MNKVVGTMKREKLNVIGDMLSAMRRRLKIVKAAGTYSTYGEGDKRECIVLVTKNIYGFAKEQKKNIITEVI